jgi:Domain of unknown function (DUF1905)/Bacteriocin-protection, YdeI or OmpD-Associated
MKKYGFEARIEAGDGGGAFVFFPYDAQQEFGTRGRVPVQATFDGVAYRGSLIRYGEPQHMLLIRKDIRTQLGKAPGDKVSVVLWRDEEERKLELPPEVAALLKQEGVLGTFEKLSYSHQREYLSWIAGAKREETRVRRMEKAVTMLREGLKTPNG